MTTSIGVAQASLAGTTQATVTAQAMRMGMWESAPMSAQTLPTGTWTLSIASSEANAASNFQPTFCLYVWRPSTGAMVGSALYDHTADVTEPGTSETAGTLTTGSISGVAVNAGDILVCEIWRDSVAQGGATARTNTFYYDGTTEASTTSCASFLLCNGGTISLVTTAPAGLAAATGTAQATSPALILSGFGTFTGVHSLDTINSVSVALTHKEATGATAPTVQLWNGTTAQIGTTQTGTSSASTVTDTFTFTGLVSYAQLATLQVRVTGNGASGSEEFADAVGLTVNYTPAPGVAYAGLAAATGVAEPPAGAGQFTAANAGLAAATGTAQGASVPYLLIQPGISTGAARRQAPSRARIGPSGSVSAGIRPAAATGAATTTATAGLAAATGTAQSACALGQTRRRAGHRPPGPRSLPRFPQCHR